jgi:hypothetical protein
MLNKMLTDQTRLHYFYYKRDSPVIDGYNGDLSSSLDKSSLALHLAHLDMHLS